MHILGNLLNTELELATYVLLCMGVDAVQPLLCEIFWEAQHEVEEQRAWGHQIQRLQTSHMTMTRLSAG